MSSELVGAAVIGAFVGVVSGYPIITVVCLILLVFMVTWMWFDR